MVRAPCCEKVGLKRGRWSAEEDEALAKCIAEHGEGSWRSVPKNAGLLRCGKSCRLRWINYLKDGVTRGNYSNDEDELIVKLHATLGNRWSLIASQLPGRTDNEIKNYWNSHLSRQFHTFPRTYAAGNDTTITIDISKLSAADKKRGGRTPGQSLRSDGAQSNTSDGPCSQDETWPNFGILEEAQVDDLLDMDWEGFASHLWGAEPQAAAAPSYPQDLESFESWLLS